LHKEERSHEIIPDRITLPIYEIMVTLPEFSAEPPKSIPGMRRGLTHAAVSAENTHLAFIQQFSGLSCIGKIAVLKKRNPG
jgi:hypothetical protein